ncbi:hypothetical protein GIB67_000765 [Kingdonia uniflora]|uniref:Uncharacterized protein n=1 Tax=Kingdonia uniflora TaxID=39325 RepID=A0A7J7ND61_9MAGN|nr:hypothetical protein GIB67_000765 [Kingdonia uniflora]
MEFVMNNVAYVDRTRLRSVCKNWQTIRPVQPLVEMPWLLTWHKKSLTACKLYNPYHKKTYIVKITGLKDPDEDSRKSVRVRVFAQPLVEMPWLLTWHKKSLTSCKLYNPYHKKTYIVKITGLKDPDEDSRKSVRVSLRC